jgi:hypothetical protein
MSLFIDFNIKQSDNAKELSFTETTGIYNASTNPGGYGAPNDNPADVTALELKITPPGGTEVVINMLIPATGFPTENKSLEYIIKSQNIGLGTDIELSDGLYIIKYAVTSPSGGTIAEVSTQKILISGKARCCVAKLMACIDLCDCDGTERARALEAWTYYKSAVYCAAVGDEAKFTELLAIIKGYCNGC